MRRVFIIRKDLHLKSGKLVAMIGHLCEAYWTNFLKTYADLGCIKDNEFVNLPAVETYGSGKTGPALYKHPDLYKLSKEAFDRGEKSFKVLEENPRKTYSITVEVKKDIWENYVNSIFTKTVCECRNKNQLLKAAALAEELGLKENNDWGYINDRCLTDLKPENEDGTCTIGIWFAPLEDDIAHKISKKFQLYRDE